MHLHLGADDLWRRRRIHADALSQQLEDSLNSCSHFQTAPRCLTSHFARLYFFPSILGHHKQVLRPHRSSAYLDPHLPGGFFSLRRSTVRAQEFHPGSPFTSQQSPTPSTLSAHAPSRF